LASTTLDSDVSTYAYDALQRRVSKSVGEDTTVFVNVHKREGGQTFAEYALGADPTTTPALRKYIYGRYIDEPLAKVETTTGSNTELHYYHANPLYSVIALTDESGDVLERYAYAAYGAPTILQPDGSLDSDQLSDFDNDILYAGYRYDPESGQFYDRLRMYDPHLGRFMQRDPLGFVDGMSLYQYVGSRPLVMTDPTGGCGQPTPPKPPKPPMPGPPPDGDWGEGGTSKGNCYRFCIGDKLKPGEPHDPFPGGTDPGGHITCKDVIDGAKKDGAKDPDKDGNCPKGWHKVAAVIQDKSKPGWNDYHWYRLDPDGCWRHKRGSGPVECLDASGKPITDPEKCDRGYRGGAYDKFCGYLCFKDGTDIDPPPKPPGRGGKK
jgi:RHS repeat-associated protein